MKLILNAVGYGPVAQLQGIYRTKFVDDRNIPADCYGYVALAQGLGMVAGNNSNRFLPNSNATRAQAAVMLYNLMARQTKTGCRRDFALRQFYMYMRKL